MTIAIVPLGHDREGNGLGKPGRSVRGYVHEILILLLGHLFSVIRSRFAATSLLPGLLAFGIASAPAAFRG